MPGMRSIVALALLAPALALPATTPRTTTTTSNDNSPAFVQLSVARALCDKLSRMGGTDEHCANLRQFRVADFCKTDASQPEDTRGVATLLKLALGRVPSGDSNDSTTSIGPLLKLAFSRASTGGEGGNDASTLRPLLRLAVTRLDRSGTTDEDSKSILPLLKLALGHLGSSDTTGGDDDGEMRDLIALVKLDLDNMKSGASNTRDAGLFAAVKDILDCDNANSGDSDASRTIIASISVTAGAAATQTVRARDMDMFAATRLASLKVIGTHTATTSESASPTETARSGSKLAPDSLMSEPKDRLSARELKLLSATRVASLALTATRAAATSEESSPTGYSHDGYDSSSLDLDSITYSEGKNVKYDTEKEDANDMPVF